MTENPTAPTARSRLRRCAAVPAGLYRSAVLVALTVLVPAVGGAVAWGGGVLAYSWSEGWSAPWFFRALARVGETLVVAVWVLSAVQTVHAALGRVLARTARRMAHRWLGLRLAVTYREPRPVTRMATGHWWDGHEYHKSEREARRKARMNARFHDPQFRWDGVWNLVAGVTVLPVAAAPLAALAGGIVLLVAAHPLGGVLLVLGGLAAAPFAWRILGPVASRFLGPIPRTRLGRRVDELEAVRADMTQTQAAELERIERGLHDGAQARLVAMGMSVQIAERLVDADPERAKAILADARASSVAALEELRSLVRGINPPVLTERGLVDAVRALALDAPLAVTVESSVPSRPERPVESALYFAVAELLANTAKHARATRAAVELAYAEGLLTATVTDDGAGGADASAGSGLRGIERRLAAFDGLLTVDSPVGGPTRVTVAVPCVLS